ncbi:tyrosine--tRNA ligase [Wenzhouxiangella sp. XN24]|uniref:tyrosine--tRNA ligase n=1 Tax=Wenzhouxiangella sp. XN24 TaxID=2713569 RepID=UPI0013E9E241|nr:tyrosine--tRNA ligase [Wenzhouxiangella sp. XN24]NGX15954.1 tyrosine--tRNA ligase [Wenzhouxiangella sp. XN24]
MKPAKDQLAELRRGTEEVLVDRELEERLAAARPLRIKAGFDPTAPDLHLGHTVLINKMRQFQVFGHDVIFLIGDFTGMIGDPTGKNATRPPLTPEEITANAATYEAQIYKILDPDQTRVEFNSRWMGEMSAADLVQLAARHTVARMLERDDFSRRYAEGRAIAIHEFLYPLVQGYDSVALQADVELGGTDQKFNLLVGRQLQQAWGQPPQVVMTVPLLEGLDGIQKMSKSLDNYVGIDEPPASMFGKLMSISDELMWRYFELLSFRPLGEIEGLRAAVAEGRNPMEVKFELAREVTARFHGEAGAAAGRRDFDQRIRAGAMPEEMESRTLVIGDEEIGLAAALTAAGLTASNSEAFREIRQRAVRVDGERVEDTRHVLRAGERHVLAVGKRRIVAVELRRA